MRDLHEHPACDQGSGDEALGFVLSGNDKPPQAERPCTLSAGQVVAMISARLDSVRRLHLRKNRA